MPSFTDSKDRAWTIHVTPWTMREVKAFAGVNLGTVLNDGMQPLAELLEDPTDVCSVIYALCKEQADTRGIDLRDFMEGIVGDPFDDATAALVEGLRDFFGPRRGAMLTATLVLMKTDKGQSKKKIDRLMKKLTSTNSPSIWRRCWEWTRGILPAANC